MIIPNMRSVFSEYRKQYPKAIAAKSIIQYVNINKKAIKDVYKIERGDHDGSVWLKENAPLLLEACKNLDFRVINVSEFLFYAAYEFLQIDCLSIQKDSLIPFYTALSEEYQLNEEELYDIPNVLFVSLLALIAKSSLGDRKELPKLFRLFHELRSESFEVYGNTFSPLEKALRGDPTGHYSKMTKQTQNIYKAAIKREAKKQKKSAEKLTKEKLILANEKRRHVGEFISKEKHRIFPIIPILLVYFYLLSEFSIAFASFFLTVLISIPLYFFVRDLIHFIISLTTFPEPLPALKIEHVEKENKTCVVITALLQTSNDVKALCNKIYEYKINNANENDHLYFGLICDLKESETKELDSDASLINVLEQNILTLNQKDPVFFSIVRKRTYHESERKWVGWERKRGAIEEFVSFLCGELPPNAILIGEYERIVGSEYLITLDADTRLSIGQAKRLIGYAAHPLNQPKLKKVGRVWRVTEGYGILQPKIAPSLLEKIKTPFGKMIGNGSGNIFYASASYDHMQYFHGEANFCGKGLIHVKTYRKVIANTFPEQKILSHDMPEGALLRCGLLTNEYFSDSNPQNTKSFYQRQHRWIRGDVQNLFVVGRLSRLRKAIYFESIARYFVPIFEFLFLFAVSRLETSKALAGLGLILLFHGQNLLFAFTSLFLSGNLETMGRRFSTKMRNVLLNAAYQFFFSLSAICFEAYYYTDAIVRSLYRMTVSRKNLLEWQVFSPFSSSGKMLFFYLPSLLLSIIPLILTKNFILIPVFLLWCFFPIISIKISKPYKAKKKQSKSERAFLLEKARKEFLFFERLVNEKTSYLPPDNIQTKPDEQIAMRTSPTNIGLYLASLVAAREMEIISENELISRIKNTAQTLEKLERWKGHLFNWYDLNSLQVIGDRFVSTVDSGNYFAGLIVVSSALKKCKQTKEIAMLSEKIQQEIYGADFRALYHLERNLFRVGARPDFDLYSGSDYDLYMSEARITAYLAISLGQIPVSHWITLKRPLLSYRGRVGIGSWTGTAFEYFMAPLFLPIIENSMEDESLDYALFCQEKYGILISPDKKVFGISESGFSLRDEEERYQYKAFGVPYLSVLQDKNQPKVISPYSSFLFLSRQSGRVIDNLKCLSEFGMEGDFGYYEAMEFHSKFLGDRTIVSSYMAHHKGMTMLAIANACCDNVIQKHFISFDAFSSKLELLAERFPIEGKIQKKKKYEQYETNKTIKISKQEFEPSLEKKHANLVSDGKTSIINFDNGENRILWKHLDLFVPNSGGIRCNIQSEKLCVSFPTIAKQKGKVRFLPDKTEFKLRENGKKIDVVTELIGSRSAILFRIDLQGFPEKTEIKFDFDVALENAKEYSAHPAFQTLALEAKCENGHLTIRKRGIKKHRYLHLLCSENIAVSVQEKNHESFFEYKALLKPTVSLRVNLAHGENKSVAFLFVPSERETAEPSLDWLDGSLRLLPEIKKQSVIKLESQLKLCCYDEKCRKLEQKFLLGAFEKYEYFQTEKEFNRKKDWLWKFGISGDYPFVLISVTQNNKESTEEIDCVLRVAKRLLLSGIQLEFVFVQQSSSDYFNPERDVLTDLISKYQCEFLIGKHPGIHVIGANDEEREQLCQIAADCILTECNLNRIEKENTIHFYHSEEFPEKNAEAVGELIENGFSINKQIYSPKEPFSHVISNRICGFVCNQNSLGFTWHRNSGLNRISKWDNILTKDDGEKIYFDFDGVRYDLIQLATNVTWKRHFAIYKGAINGEEYCVIATVSEIVAGKIIWLNLPKEKLKDGCLIYSFVPALGTAPKGNVLIKKENDTVQFFPATSSEYPGTAYFFCKNGVQKLLRNGNRIQIHVNWKEENLMLLGGYNGNSHFDFIKKTIRSESLESLLAKEKAFSDHFFPKILPPKHFWIRYQTVHSRFFGRTGLYQSSGAYGFRDQLQDSLAFLSYAPEICKIQILRCASHQFSEGDVQHWWHTVSNGTGAHPGIRSRCSDDYLWLLFAVSEYINRTNDVSVLQLKAPLIASNPLKETEDESYVTPKKDESVSILEHMKRCVLLFINRGLGPHNLPDIGSGDWNDGMNQLNGESVWLGFFASICLKRVAIYFDQETQNAIGNHLKRLVDGLQASFNGCWYPRVFSEDGKIYGNDPSLEEACSVDLITQAFAGLCAVEFSELNPKDVKDALENAYDTLVDEKNRTVKLFTKPFVDSVPSPGYIQRYVGGVRENGGQYTHAAVFFALALIRFGKKYNESTLIEKGINVAKLLDPFENISIKAYEKYRREPYVLCGDVYSARGLKGHGGWSWYTGAAGWYDQLLSEIEKLKST